ncbi:MAG: SgcJ/EcaC family oxidoreductase [Pirellulales bacterium]
MKKSTRLVLGGLVALLALMGIRAAVRQAAAQQAAGSSKKKPAAAAPAKKETDPHAKEIAAIKQTAQAFAKAFNSGDAKAVAALWTAEGDYIDDAGERFQGHAAIEKEYARFFAANKDAKLTLMVDHVQLLSETAAIEDGRAVVEVGDKGDATSSQYTTVHVKADGKWLMANVRDTHLDSISNSNDLDDLDWLVGSWSAEQGDQEMLVTCRWIAQKTYLERTYSLTKDGKPVTSGVQIVGWNPQAGYIQSWNFSSGGGHAIGVWSPHEGGWTIETHGMMADGAPTSAVNMFTRVDDDSFSWQSIEREAEGTALPDTPIVVLKRVVEPKE